MTWTPSARPAPTPSVLMDSRTIEDIEAFLQAGYDVNKKDSFGFTALFYAVKCPIDFILFLLDKGAQVNERSNAGEVPLMRAVTQNRIDVAHLFIHRGADVNSRNNDGHTPLMFAARHGHADIGRLLIERDANVDEVDNEGRSVADWARLNNHPEFMEMVAEAVEERRLNKKDSARVLEEERHEAVVLKLDALRARAPALKIRPRPLLRFKP